MPYEIYQVHAETYQNPNSEKKNVYMKRDKVRSEQDYDFFNLLSQQLDLYNEGGKVKNMMVMEDKFTCHMIIIAIIHNPTKNNVIIIQSKNKNLYHMLKPYDKNNMNEFEMACETMVYGRQLHWQFENLYYHQVDGIFNVHYF